MKRMLLLTLAVFLTATGLSAQVDASLRVEPRVIIPTVSEVDGDPTARFGIGGGLSLQAELGFPFANWFFAEAVLDAGILPINSGTTSMQAVSLGIGPGVRFVPVSRLVVKSSVYGGGEILLYDNSSVIVPFIEPRLDFDFQISPSFNLGLGGGYRMVFGSGGTVLQAATASINLAYNFGAGKSGADIEARPMLDPIYPLYFTYYEDHPTGNVTLVNRERDTITDVRVSYFVPQYMDRPVTSEDLADRLRTGDEVSLPLYALFSKDIFEVTEGLTVAGEIQVDYKWLGKEFTNVEQVSIDILNRNSMTWDDDKKAAAYVTSNNPLVKSYSKNIAANVRSDNREVFDLNFRIAMGLFEALTLHGTGYVIDAASAYANLSEDSDAVDFVQFPAETLAYQAGDCDDLSVLYNAMCEAAAVETAFVTVPGHIFTAFNLGIGMDRAERLFTDTSDLIEREDSVWVPVEVTLVEQGFREAWRVGAREWREADKKGQAGFYPTHEAWETFKPAEVNTGELVFLPDPDEVMAAYNSALDRLIYQEIAPIEQAINNRIRSEGGSPALYNRMGVVYAKYGLLDDAHTWFRKAASGTPYASAEVNLGNVAYLRQDFETAADHYQNALDIDESNARAMLGLAKANFELEDYRAADDSMTMLADANPAMAEQYAYLGTVSEAPILRASSAVSKDVYGWDE